MGDFVRKCVLKNSGHIKPKAFCFQIKPVGQSDIAPDHSMVHAPAIDGKININQRESSRAEINIFCIFLSFTHRLGVRGCFGKIFLSSSRSMPLRPMASRAISMASAMDWPSV